MEFSIQLHTNKSGWSIVYIERTQVIISPKNIFLSLKITFVAANSADPDEMPHNVAFHLVFTVCQSTHLGDSGLKMVTRR